MGHMQLPLGQPKGQTQTFGGYHRDPFADSTGYVQRRPSAESLHDSSWTTRFSVLRHCSPVWCCGVEDPPRPGLPKSPIVMMPPKNEPSLIV